MVEEGMVASEIQLVVGLGSDAPLHAAHNSGFPTGRLDFVN